MSKKKPAYRQGHERMEEALVNGCPLRGDFASLRAGSAEPPATWVTSAKMF